MFIFINFDNIFGLYFWEEIQHVSQNIYSFTPSMQAISKRDLELEVSTSLLETLQNNHDQLNAEVPDAYLGDKYILYVVQKRERERERVRLRIEKPKSNPSKKY